MLLAIQTKLKSKARGPTTFHFHHDCYRVSGDGKSKMLMKDDFAPCKFYDQQDQCLDSNGDGVRIKFPVKVQPVLSWSPKMSVVGDCGLTQVPQMPNQKVTIDFVWQPFSILNM